MTAAYAAAATRIERVTSPGKTAVTWPLVAHARHRSVCVPVPNSAMCAARPIQMLSM
jgi:hypothetical protein